MLPLLLLLLVQGHSWQISQLELPESTISCRANNYTDDQMVFALHEQPLQGEGFTLYPTLANNHIVAVGLYWNTPKFTHALMLNHPSYPIPGAYTTEQVYIHGVAVLDMVSVHVDQNRASFQVNGRDVLSTSGELYHIQLPPDVILSPVVREFATHGEQLYRLDLHAPSTDTPASDWESDWLNSDDYQLSSATARQAGLVAIYLGCLAIYLQ